MVGRTHLIAMFGCAILVSGLIATAQPATAPASTQPAGPQRWEKAIAAFEEQDRRTPPPADPVLFIGSSSIAGWKLREFFSDLPALNRGFGGSQIADSLHFADRIVIPYRARTIVFYAGENDIVGGKSPDQVADDFQQFTRKVRAAVPETKIIFIGLKPSPSRWKFIEQFRETNRLIREFIETETNMIFIDVESVMLDENGRPREELFREDRLHMTRTGYELWTGLVRPHVQAASAASQPAGRAAN